MTDEEIVLMSALREQLSSVLLAKLSIIDELLIPAPPQTSFPAPSPAQQLNWGSDTKTRKSETAEAG